MVFCFRGVVCDLLYPEQVTVHPNVNEVQSALCELCLIIFDVFT